MTNLHKINAVVPHGSVLGPTLYLLYTSDLPLSDNVVIGTFADDTVILAMDKNPVQASTKLQKSLDKISLWLKTWCIKANEAKSVQVTFTNRRETCPPVKLNEIQISQANKARYLGLYLDRRLTWRKQIFTKRKALGQELRKLYWLVGRGSQLSLQNKLLNYKSILKPVWFYGIQLWGTSANSNIEILRRFQSKYLRIATDAPWYITNNRLYRELGIPTVKEDIKVRATKYKEKILNHPNILVTGLMNPKRTFYRLKRKAPQDLI